MTLTSYAQNYEDVMLWRALKHIKKGFYFDIGAAWPTKDSVTKHFYDNSWRGINIEPNPELYSQLKLERPRDINLCLAISDKSGVLTMNFLDHSGLSTLNEEIAKKHIADGWPCIKKKVNVRTLASIWEEHVPSQREVHFLKIDVEGQEKEVLKGNDWSRFRPWVVLLESTLPLTQTENHEEWEEILTKSRYHFVYADGINRFYVAKEHLDLAPAFKYPPNVFDDFIQEPYQQMALNLSKLEIERNAQVELLTNELSESKIQREELVKKFTILEIEKNSQIGLLNNELTAKIEQATKQIEIVTNKKDTLIEELNSIKLNVNNLTLQTNHLDQELQNIYKSKSWRITYPLRKINQLIKDPLKFGKKLLIGILARIKNLIQWFSQGLLVITHFIKACSKFAKLFIYKILIKTMSFFLQHPRLYLNTKHYLDKFPRLKIILSNIYLRQHTFVSVNPSPRAKLNLNFSNLEHSELSYSARRLYSKLENSLRKSKGPLSCV